MLQSTCGDAAGMNCPATHLTVASNEADCENSNSPLGNPSGNCEWTTGLELVAVGGTGVLAPGVRDYACFAHSGLDMCKTSSKKRHKRCREAAR